MLGNLFCPTFSALQKVSWEMPYDCNYLFQHAVLKYRDCVSLIVTLLRWFSGHSQCPQWYTCTMCSLCRWTVDSWCLGLHDSQWSSTTCPDHTSSGPPHQIFPDWIRLWLHELVLGPLPRSSSDWSVTIDLNHATTTCILLRLSVHLLTIWCYSFLYQNMTLLSLSALKVLNWSKGPITTNA